MAAATIAAASTATTVAKARSVPPEEPSLAACAPETTAVGPASVGWGTLADPGIVTRAEGEAPGGIVEVEAALVPGAPIGGLGT